MEKFLKITYLYDFYGQLLTLKQQEILKMYYLDDLSLGEISKQQQVSRQSIHDTIKKAEKKLFYFEEKLGLLDRFMRQRVVLNEIVEDLDQLGQEVSPKNAFKVNEIKRFIQQLLREQ